MTPEHLEVLVVLDVGTSEARAMSLFDPRIRIIHRLPPRLLVLSCPPGVPAPTGVPGCQCYAGAVPAPALRGLGGNQRLFAEAWSEARKPKRRVGDGLSWDAPGRNPPDPPRDPGGQ